ncbi:MAG: ABC transporter permease [Bacteroidota bacterium]
MWKNYLKVGLRNFTKHKVYSGINVLGLTLGISSFLFILMYLQDEWSFDRYHENIDRIYRVHSDLKSGETTDISIYSPRPLKTTLVEDYPEVEQSFSFHKRWSMWFEYGDKKLLEEQLIYADNEIFDILSFDFVAGDPSTALKEPRCVVLSQKVAEKYFGAKNPVGETIIINNDEPHKITGVVEELPINSHFDFNIFMSLPDYVDDEENLNWGDNNVVTYVLLKKDASAKALEHKLSKRLAEWFPDILLAGKPVPYQEFAAAGNYVKYSLMPAKDIHLQSHRKNEFLVNGNLQYVQIFLIIGLFIIVLACINFANLTTARAATRAREVGVRKAIGAARKNLIYQFLGESSLITATAFTLAFGVVLLALPWFNQLSGKALMISEFIVAKNIFLVAGLGIFITFLSGVYPAFVLSSFQPTEVLKGNLGKSTRKSHFRNGLVVLQFLVTIALITGTMIVTQQLNFLQNQNLGFESDQVYVLYDVNQAGDQREVLQQRINQFPEVTHSTMTVFFPTESHDFQQLPLFAGTSMGEGDNVLVQLWSADENYISTFGLNIIQGENFSLEKGTKGEDVILNEAAAKRLGFEDAVGQKVSFGNGEDIHSFNVVGVVENFHFESFRYDIKPMMLFYNNFNAHLAIRAQTDDWESLIRNIRKEYRAFVPTHPFLGGFINERFENRYDAEIRLGAVVKVFTGIALFLACIGLFGLATYMAQQRMKEIGIRKVLGASVTGIVALLSKDFIKLVGIAFLIATPIAWYLMNDWLQDFAYSIDIQWWVFALAGLAAIGIALLTVSVQSVRAALANPVKSLRNE